MRALSIRVIGKVQGVYFRASTKEFALNHGINGYCKNEADGSVFIFAEGDEKQMEKLIEWCNTGPEMAEVKSVMVEEAELMESKSFEIRK